MKQSNNRRFFAVALLVALLIAGVGSFYASSHPDGLEFVAEKTGFGHTATDSATSDSPFADYGTKGVDNERLGGGIAGVVGVLMVLALGSGLAFALRRRTSRTESLTEAEQPSGTTNDTTNDTTVGA